MNPLLARPNPDGNGYTWTIASRISDALAEVEQRFGPRDPSYFLAGWEFVNLNPGTWFPGNRKHIVIQLSFDAAGDLPRLVFQLSHEVVHLLAPTGKRSANNLEEGLASHFAEDYTLRQTRRQILSNLPSYIRARDAVRRLLAHDNDCIKRMRTVEPCISRITKELLKQEVPALTVEDAEYLAARFDRDAAP
jgi:hypothetical protein